MAKFEVYYPVRPYAINQAFGLNGDYYKAHGINIKGHNGIDLRANHGQPIYAAHDGVAYYEIDEDQGHGIVIRTTQLYDYKGQQVWMKSVYWHLCNFLKEPKYKPLIKTDGSPCPVKRGDLIAYADNTGLSTGDHLHFAIKPIVAGKAPVDGDRPDVGIGNFVNFEQTNGYLGAIDPMPYFNGKYADEPAPVVPPVPAPVDTVAVIAASEQAKGNAKVASILWAIVAFLKSFVVPKV